MSGVFWLPGPTSAYDECLYREFGTAMPHETTASAALRQACSCRRDFTTSPMYMIAPPPDFPLHVHFFPEVSPLWLLSSGSSCSPLEVESSILRHRLYVETYYETLVLSIVTLLTVYRILPNTVVSPNNGTPIYLLWGPLVRYP